MKKVIVVGGGPAGMMAAIKASERNRVILVEGNEKLGKKLYITGKGRCNVTNSRDISEFFDYIPGNPEFLYSSLYTFTNLDTMNFLESLGVDLKTERGGRVFPNSDKSSDIINALKRELEKRKVEVLLNSRVKEIKNKGSIISAIVLNDGQILQGDYFIFCTGGYSYPQTGSNGEGHELLRNLGHSISKITPSLVPLEVKEDWIKELQGLSLKNVSIKIIHNKKAIYEDFGEMLFTHYGISGPMVLSASRYIKEASNNSYNVLIDLKPALSMKELDERVQKDFAKYINKDFKNSLDDLLPQKILSIIIMLSGIPEFKKVNSITREERKNLCNIIKNFPLTIVNTRPIAEAIVTAGGISIKEIDSSTMRSKLLKNLYFAGELIDVDAFTGGYNVQIAFSTGYLAGMKVGEGDDLF